MTPRSLFVVALLGYWLDVVFGFRRVLDDFITCNFCNATQRLTSTTSIPVGVTFRRVMVFDADTKR